MSDELPYFKFVVALIDSGIWAKMSPAARALYPVLLRFSDRNFCPVYPGSQPLLKLTGFKQKSSLRKARKELISLGLIDANAGSGHRRTNYYFRFEALRGDPQVTPGGAPQHTTAGQERTPRRGGRVPPGGITPDSPYNQIHISINNTNVPVEKDPGKKPQLDFLKRRFGEDQVELAVNECRLAGLEAAPENLQKILYRGTAGVKTSWSEIQSRLSRTISGNSLKLIEKAFLEDREGVLVFQDRLPEYLKSVLRQLHVDTFFEAEEIDRRSFWRESGADL